jgi:SlyX protein
VIAAARYTLIVSDPREPDELSRAPLRIVELEVRYTHQETLLRDLSDVLYRQQQVIDGLSERVRSLEQKLGEIAAPVRAARPEDDLPPHY